MLNELKQFLNNLAKAFEFIGEWFTKFVDAIPEPISSWLLAVGFLSFCTALVIFLVAVVDTFGFWITLLLFIFFVGVLFEPLFRKSK